MSEIQNLYDNIHWPCCFWRFLSPYLIIDYLIFNFSIKPSKSRIIQILRVYPFMTSLFVLIRLKAPVIS